MKSTTWKSAANQMVKTIMMYDGYSKIEPNTPRISQQTQDAFLNTPRHEFVPTHLQNEAYEDTPLPIGSSQTISQPYIVALMTELLSVKPGQKVLEIGAGSGYQAAILATLGVDVYTIEIQSALYNDLQPKLAAWENIHLKRGDGFHGWPEAAPFDGVIITCAAKKEVPKPLLDQ